MTTKQPELFITQMLTPGTDTVTTIITAPEDQAREISALLLEFLKSKRYNFNYTPKESEQDD